MTLSPGNMGMLRLLRMLRWPNLIMMAAALFLVRYCIFLPIYNTIDLPLQTSFPGFLLLVAATVLIGAGGYVVNDILDTGLDDLNKPGKNIVGREISEKNAWTVYYSLTIAGVACGTLLSYLAGKTELGILFLVIATSLYYYSLKYKYLAVWGNLTVALLTAVSIFIVWLFEFFFLKKSPDSFILVSTNFGYLNRFVFGYSFFGFFTTFIREVIKDSQDREGDARFGCRTIPILLGEKRTRMLVSILLVLLIVLLLMAQVYLLAAFRQLALFLALADILAVYSLIILFRENTDFSRLSLLMKAIMAAGLLWMIFLWFPN
jgi:4-hydroxybenzoate polyprenyltransferase